MSCSCRAVPWRTFVRGLAQVHRLDALKPASLALAPRAAGGGGSSSLPWAALRQARALHAAQGRGQEAAAAPQISENHNGGGDGAEDCPQPLPEADIGATTDKEARRIDRKERKEGKGRREKKGRKERKDGRDMSETAEGAARPYGRERTGTHKDRPFEGAKPKHQPYKPGANPKAKPAPDAETTTTATRQLQQQQQQQQQKKPAEFWRIQKEALKEKFPEGWRPRKRLSPDALAGIRALNAQFPEAYTTEALAAKFKVPAEAIRRILKSKWTPTAAEEQGREERWFRRGKQVWEHKAALGVKPPKRWRMEGVARDPGYHEWSKQASRREREWEEEEIRKYREQIDRRKRGEGDDKGGKAGEGPGRA